LKKTFSYSILQYKHSLLLNEAINVGILFAFREDEFLHFESGNLSRIKLIYPNFDTSLVNKILKNIESKSKIETRGLLNIFYTAKTEEDFQRALLREDDSALQFTQPKNLSYPFDDTQKIIEQFTDLLLLNHEGLYQRNKHNENYILRAYNHYLFSKDKSLEKFISRNRIVESNDIKLKFDVSWKNGTTNLVKAVSFDLKEEQEIQNKSITYFGYLTKLKEYAVDNGIRYDLLLWYPQEKKLFKEYDKAVKTIQSAVAPIKIVPPEELEKYSKDTVVALSKLKEAL